MIIEQSMTRLRFRVPMQPAASVAVTVIGKPPVCVGVPERTPAAKLIPVGRVPVRLKTTGATPPVCVKVTLG